MNMNSNLIHDKFKPSLALFASLPLREVERKSFEDNYLKLSQSVAAVGLYLSTTNKRFRTSYCGQTCQSITDANTL